MGFFNDLKEDLASAVNELTDEKAEKDIASSKEHYKDDYTEFDSSKRLSKYKRDKKPNENLEREIQNILNGIEEKPVADDNLSEKPSYKNETFEDVGDVFDKVKAEETKQAAEENVITDNSKEESTDNVTENESADNSGDNNDLNPDETGASEEVSDLSDENAETESDSEDKNENDAFAVENNSGEEYYDNLTLICEGTSVKGSIEASGSAEIDGYVEGDVKANGELIITGTVIGNVEGLVVSLNSGKVRGNVKAYNGLIITSDSVLIGDIESNEAQIAGAVKGKIDVNGPVILESQAKVLGDIDCKNVQINNGAVIEGKCSQKYSDVSPSAFFDNL